MIKINSFYLKVIATLCMVIDHIAYTCLPSDGVAWTVMRIVGRLAAPLFWFCFAEGYRHTSDKLRYKLRLMLAAFFMAGGNFIIALFFQKYSHVSPLIPNMFLTMLFMAMVIDLFSKIKADSKLTSIANALMAIIIASIVGAFCEYGLYAVCSILIFYFIKSNPIKWLTYVAVVFALALISGTFLQIFSFLSVLLIMNYDNTKPKQNVKWFFYWFYPVHLWMLMIISVLINK